MGSLPTQHLPSGVPKHHSKRQTQNWPTSEHIGYMTPTMWEVPNTSQHGIESYPVEDKVSGDPQIGGVVT